MTLQIIMMTIKLLQVNYYDPLIVYGGIHEFTIILINGRDKRGNQVWLQPHSPTLSKAYDLDLF